MVSNEMIYHTGLALLAGAVFIAVIAAVVFVYTGAKLRKRLKADFGERGHRGKQYK